MGNDRRRGIGGSDATRIVAGDWYNLWMEKTGRAKPEDLSRVLPVQLGSFTQPFNRRWFEMMTGRVVSDEEKAFEHDKWPIMNCHVDGLVIVDAGWAIWEAKHLSAYVDMEWAISKYYAQLQHNMEVTGHDRAALSVIFGNQNWEYQVVEFDRPYVDKLVKQERAFWEYVQADLEPPGKMPGLSAPDLSKMVTISMKGSNSWASLEFELSINELAAIKFDTAKEEIKKLMPADAELAYGDLFCIRRTKSNALHVRRPLETDLAKIDKHKEKADAESKDRPAHAKPSPDPAQP